MRVDTPILILPRKWFWYVAREDELMMDLDGRAMLEIMQKRLERNTGRLQPRNLRVYSSHSKEHFHAVIRLRKPMDAIERMVWQLFLMDHVYRSCKNLFRVLKGTPAPSLLISPNRWTHFWRDADATCGCSRDAHKDHKRILDCPAHFLLRGGYSFAQSEG